MQTSNDTAIDRLFITPVRQFGAVCFALAWGCAVSDFATANEPPAPSKSGEQAKPASTGAPKVDLGRLLKLPDSYAKPAENRRGMGQVEWEGRFEAVRIDLQTAEIALETAQQELGEQAGDSSQWSVAAPGTNPNPENTPMSYKLRQEIRRQRESIERAERKLRDLEIEADLAEVPVEWRARHIGGQTAKPGAATPLSTYR